MNWKIANAAYILIGGLVLTPLVIHGLGSEVKPPTLVFSISILIFSMLGGMLVLYVESRSNNEKWVMPSLAMSPFGPGKQLQRYLIGALCFVWLGICCMLFGGKLQRIEWMGTLPLLIGGGLLMAIVPAKSFLKNKIE